MADFNSDGPYRTTHERDLKAYDNLPPGLRKAVREAVFNWAAEPVLARLRRVRSVKFLIGEIQMLDREQAAKRTGPASGATRTGHDPDPTSMARRKATRSSC
jgi:hypothetical protein